MSNLSKTPLVSIIIAAQNVGRLHQEIRGLFRQTYKNVEIIIAYPDSEEWNKELRRLLKVYSSQGTVKSVPFHHPYGCYRGVISDNELFMAGASLAEGKYLLFVNDSTAYSNNYVSKMIDSISLANAELAFSDFVITWKDEVSVLYTVIPEILTKESLFDVYVENAGNMFDLNFTENKLIDSGLWERVSHRIKKVYSAENLHSYIGELIFAVSLWAETQCAIYVPEEFSVLTWTFDDQRINEYCKDIKTDAILSELSVAMDVIREICFEKQVEVTTYMAYFTSFLSRFIWRTDWIKPEIKNIIETHFSLDIPKYQLNDLESRGRGINLSDFQLICNDGFRTLDDSTESELNIQIFVSMHEISYCPKNNRYIRPIQVGTALTGNRFVGMLHDDDGENISAKNQMYCELTAQYYAWKNIKDADYYGFWHYRRYMSFNDEEWGVIDYDTLNEDSLKKSAIDEAHILKVCRDYDVIVPGSWHCFEDGLEMTVYEHWCKHFEKEDLDYAVKIILQKYPQFYSAVMDVLHSQDALFCNMFIMKKELFEEYSTFCFDILFELEKQIDQKYYNTEEYRTLGHIAERLLAFYVRYLETERSEISIHYTGRTLYHDTRPEAKIEHPNKKNCVSVMLACNDSYMQYTDVLLQSICENISNEYFYDIVICHRGISKENQVIACDIFKKSNNASVRFFDITRNFEKYNRVHVDRHLTSETYYRFLVADIFEGYDRVLYLDCDMIVNADLAELFFIDMNDEYVAAVRDYDFIASCLDRPEFYRENILQYINIDDYFNYFQAGALLFNLKEIKKKFTGEKLFRTALQRDWYFHDQDILNCLFNGHVKYLDDSWNVFSLLEDHSQRSHLLNECLPANFATSYKRSRLNPKIIHYAGIPKVWDDADVDLGSLFWKYARMSPFYEKLMKNLLLGAGIRNDWILFTSNMDGGIHFFTINTINELWSSNYCVIDMMYLSNHETIEKDTLTINASMFENMQNEPWLDVKQFDWKYQIPIISDNVFFKVNKEKNIEIYVRSVGEYTGFSFTVRTLESRNIPKPVLTVDNHHFITKLIKLPEDLKGGGEDRWKSIVK